MVIRDHYVKVWRTLLCDWLKWPVERFERFVRHFQADLDETGNPLFYHYDELRWVFSLLVPDELVMQLEAGHSHPGYLNDLAHFTRVHFYPAIHGPPPFQWFAEPFDWQAAYSRYAQMLRDHGHSIPMHPDVSNYERMLIGERDFDADDTER